jgi:tetratricopeptide (TPR) repeat protein/predicted aspartyl protease
MRRAGVLAVAIAGLCSVAGAAGAACRLTALMNWPVTMLGARPIVHASLNGTDVQFEADSGAFYSMISPGSAQELHLRKAAAPFGFTVQGVGGDVMPEIATVHAFGIQKHTVHDVEFMVGGSELSPAVGVIGQNVLGIADVEYDFAHGMMRLVETEGCWRDSMAYWANDKPFSTISIDAMDDRNRATLGAARVNDKPIQVQFDTGASVSFLTLRAAARAGLSPTSPGAVSGGYTHGIGRGLVQTWIVPVDSFTIGDEMIKHTKLRIGDVDLNGPDMLLGADFFLSHRVFVANSQRKLYFTYNGGSVFDVKVADEAPAVNQTAAAASAGAAPENPKDADGFSRRGAARAGRGDLAGAIADYSRAIELAPNDPDYALQRAEARLQVRQPSLAMDDLGVVIRLKPDSVPARLLRASLRLDGRERDLAREDVDAAAKALSPAADANLEVAEFYERLDAFDPAIAAYSRWIPVHGEDQRLPQALNGRCWSRALANKELDGALSDCDRAVRTYAYKDMALDSRGLVHLRRGEYDRAVADYNAALAINPKIAWSYYGRGLAELKTGETAKSTADFAAAHALAPNLTEEAARYGLPSAS